MMQHSAHQLVNVSYFQRFSPVTTSHQMNKHASARIAGAAVQTARAPPTKAFSVLSSFLLSRTSRASSSKRKRTRCACHQVRQA